PVWRTNRRPAWAAFFVYNVLLVGSFLGLYFVFTAAQSEAVGDTLRGNYWAGAFPPILEPLKLLVWLIDAHTSHMFSYPVGGALGARTATSLCFLAALVVLWRRGRRALLALCVAPFGLALAASSLGRYPYGGAARTMLFLAPMICLLAGLGASALLARFRRAW